MFDIKNKISKTEFVFFAFIISLFILSEFFYFWIFVPFGASLLLFYTLKWVKNNNIFLYSILIIASIFLAFALGELFFTVRYANAQESTSIEQKVPVIKFGENHVHDDLLGYSLEAKRVLVHDRRVKSSNGELKHDVTYTIDNFGYRATPDNSKTAKTLVLLFGCSFTFGQGLGDTDAFANILANKLGEDYQVINRAIYGYGSHQMYALLQSDRLDYLQGKYDRVIGIYLTLKTIEERSAGMTNYDKNGPFYILAENGEPAYQGSFPKDRFELRGKFRQSLLLQSFSRAKLPYSGTKSHQLALHSALINASAKAFEEKFDNSSFVTILYDNETQLKPMLNSSLVDVVEIYDAFAPYEPHDEIYLIPYDTHPNANASRIIAEEYLKIVQGKME